MPKRVKPLTEAEIRTVKPAQKNIYLFDGGGLFLEVTPGAGKLWRMKYLFQGRSRNPQRDSANRRKNGG